MQYCVFLGSLSYEAYLCIVGCIVMYIGVVGEAVCFGMNVGFFCNLGYYEMHLDIVWRSL